jgi:hypothetical protein
MLSSCIYNPPQFHLNCTYLVPFLFCFMALCNTHPATDLKTFLCYLNQAVSLNDNSHVCIGALAQPLPYTISTNLLYYLF